MAPFIQYLQTWERRQCWCHVRGIAGDARGLGRCRGCAAPPKSHRMGWKELRDQPVLAPEPWAGTPPSRDGLCLLLGRFSQVCDGLRSASAPDTGKRRKRSFCLLESSEFSAFWKGTYFQPNKRRTKMIKFSMVKTRQLPCRRNCNMGHLEGLRQVYPERGLAKRC